MLGYLRERGYFDSSDSHWGAGRWFVLVLVVMLWLVMVSGVDAASINLPQTGQTTSYATGDDGSVRAGVAWPDPRFTDNGDQTITDKLTALMWAKNALLPAVGDCVGGSSTWPVALVSYVTCANDASYLGYTDWRIPNINELESLTNAQQSNIGTWLGTQGFIGMGDSLYWSSTTYKTFNSDAVIVDMSDGTVNSGDKSNSIYALLVRDSGLSPYGSAYVWASGQTTSYAADDDGELQKGMPWPNPRFTDNGNSTVTDKLTGLIWLKDAGTPTIGSCPGGFMSWGMALTYVACLNTASYQGYTDWRLPNRRELLSLINRGSFGPSLPASHPFTNVQSGFYWSSTTNPHAITDAWAIYMSDGLLSAYNKTSNNNVWPVRGGQTSLMINLSVSTSGSGSGTVTSSPSGIDCGSTCSALFAVGTSVTLTATASDNSTFSGWGGDCSGTSSTCPLTMSATKSVTATFTPSCNFAITPTSKTFTLSGGSDNVTVTAVTGCTWSATSNVSWISVTSGSSGSGNGSVFYSVTANTGALQRIGTMTIAGKTFTVTQDGTGCTYSITPTGKQFTSSVGNDSVSVTAPTECTWSAASNFSWITVTSGSSGSGNGSVTYSVTANTDAGQRMGTMTIAGQTFNVTQDGATCSYSINPTSKQFTSVGGNDSVSVTTGTGCTWGASSDVSWITLTSGNIGTGSGGVTYSVAANTTANQRMGTMSIARQTFTVYQDAPSSRVSFTRYDFDADGKSDILWRNDTTGDVYIWLMNGTSIKGGYLVAKGVSADWVIKAVGDFNGDGKSDILLQNANNGAVYLWLMDGATIKAGGYVVEGLAKQWDILAIGDFNGDGKSDIMLRDTNSGDVYVWFMNGTGITGGGYVVIGMNSEWDVAAIGDFNGDGKSDVLWQNTTTGDVAAWLMNGLTMSTVGYVTKGLPGKWRMRAVSDFDGDGKADVLWQDTITGDVAMWLLNGLSIVKNAYVTYGVPSNWQFRKIGDYSGDGKTDMLWQDSATGGIYIWLLNGTSISGGGYATGSLPSNWLVQ
ncbi:MAG: DUF1566 domain-containing protein [Nitrospirae bacterium]|nr:DUF1566 domain-containing protein [Nitrospirota bacterium]MBF0591313.1 DUF1566 domain-containing protein [Nitrospirota bacterium]